MTGARSARATKEYNLAHQREDNINPILVNVVVEMCTFLSLSDHDAVNPDAAITQLEQISSMLKDLSRDDKESFLRHVGELADRAHAAADDERATLLKALPRHLGLE
jgi:hypothetical protein